MIPILTRHATLPAALCSILASHVLAGSEPSSTEALREAVEARVGTACELQLISLPPEPGQQVLELTLALGGAQVDLRLHPHSVRAEDYRLWVQDSNGELDLATAPPVATYRGSARGAAGVLAAAGLVSGGVKGVVLIGDGPQGEAWFFEPLAGLGLSAAPGLHAVYTGVDPFAGGVCGADRLPSVGADSQSGGSFLGGSGCFRVARLAVDTDHEFFANGAGTVAGTAANIDAITASVNLVFARDVQIEHELGDVIVRPSEPDPYTTFDDGGLLGEFRDHWRGPLAGLSRDIAHMITGKEIDGNVVGLAYVGVICNFDYGYAWTQDTSGLGNAVGIMTHELGHSWSSPHCLDVGCNSMCGGCLNFGPNTTSVIQAHRDSRPCLDTTDGFSIPVPPHVIRDIIVDSTGPVTIDVLENDLDGNCETVVIDAFDSISEQGGTVSLSAGTGPGGRDELTYTPAPGFDGNDAFYYTGGDGSGLQATARVRIGVNDGVADRVLHMRFDETFGPDAIDSSSSNLHGVYNSTAIPGNPGVAGHSVGLNGFSARVQFENGPGIAHLRDDVTVSTWIYPGSTSGVQRIFGNESSWSLGLSGDQLLFTTWGIRDYTYDIDLEIQQWTHIAAVFTTGHDVLFYKDGAYVGQRNGNQQSAPSSQYWHFGTDDGSGQFFFGLIDDLQVYDLALGSSDVQFLYDYPGAALEPCSSATSYCVTSPNSVGAGSTMSHQGQPNTLVGDFTLIASDLPSFQSGVFFYGPDEAQVAFGDGFRCIGGGIYRLPIVSTSFGAASYPLDFAALPPGAPILPASTWNFQFWYRDPGGPGGTGFNLSDAISATFCQ